MYLYVWQLVAAAVFLLVGTGPVHAGSYAERVREKVLGNGLKILVLEDHKAPVGVIQVWYRVGSRNENLGRTGLSHLLEHLMFKGTKKIGPEEYSRIIQRNGGNDNAFTTQDYTTYFATLASDRLGVAIDLESDRMVNLVLNDEVYQPERAVVAEERRLRTDDSPVSALFELIGAEAYTAHPYQWPIIGWMNDIQQATREDAEHYYRTYYKPTNAFVVIVGDVSADQIVATLEQSFGALPSDPPPPPVRSVEPPQRGERRVVLKKEAELPFLGIAYHVPNTRHPDAAALEVLAGLLSDGKSSRLYKDLVYVKRLARDVGAGYDDKSKDPGLFTLYGQPLPGKSIAELEKALLTHVEAFKTTPIKPRELQKVKNGVEASFTLAQDSFFYQGMLLGQYEILGDWRLIDQYVPSIRAVRADDVQRVAATYLTPDNRTVGTLVPLPSSKPRRPMGHPPGMGGLVH